MKSRCAKKIWEKFSNIEKKLWQEFYSLFKTKENFAVGFEDKKKQEITAHNMACEAIWLLQTHQNKNGLIFYKGKDVKRHNK